MRPVDKLPVGAKIVLANGETHTINSDYSPYKYAKSALITNLGMYCSYCEDAYHQERDLHVEHIQPKNIVVNGQKPYAHLETTWSNFLLSCATCNGADNKDTKDVVLGQVHLPHLNNTYLSLKYRAGGVVEANPELTGISYSHAEALLQLVGLDKTPVTSKSGDKRWLKRSDDWNLAVRFLDKYRRDEIDIDTIIELVKSRGGWSIWYTVFCDIDEVRKALLTFPGTAKLCFDPKNHYNPIPRNPQNAIDPV